MFFNVIDPLFYYHASWAVSKLKLKSELVEYMAVGLLTVLIDMPYDIIGTKFVHWIWHDTDPGLCKLYQIKRKSQIDNKFISSFCTFLLFSFLSYMFCLKKDDRNFWSPWNLYNFNLCFSFSFHYWFHSIRGWIEKRKNLDKWEAGSL